MMTTKVVETCGQYFINNNFKFKLWAQYLIVFEEKLVSAVCILSSVKPINTLQGPNFEFLNDKATTVFEELITVLFE
jgi:hypothetical protein